MSVDRAMWLTDRWGAQWEENITLERFAELFDELDPADKEHCVVDIDDEHGWNIEFSLTDVGFGNLEEGTDEGTLVLTDRTHALAIAAEFFNGDFELLRRRPWA